jgi:tetratricopeptide (TPR) repeat protein
MVSGSTGLAHLQNYPSREESPLKSRSVILWVAAAGAFAAAVTALAVARARRVPRLPAAVRYDHQPAMFNAALAQARTRVVNGAYGSEDVRALAHLYQANRLYVEARACYAILAKGPEGLTAKDHYYLADIAQYQGDLETSEAELKAALRDDPDYLPAELALGDVLFKAGRPEAGAAEYIRIVAALPNQPQAMFALARIDLLKGNDEAAVTRLGTLVMAHPDMTSGAALLAQVYDRRGEAARANAMRQWSRQKPEPVPEDPWMDALLGDCYDIQRLGLKFEEYFATGQIALAVPFLRRVEELDPNSPIPQLLRGWTDARDHDDKGAVEEYQAALRKGGDPEKICPYLGMALVSLGRVQEAASLMAEYYAKRPDSVPILIAYSQLALKEGDSALAKTLLAKVVAREPYLTSANMSLASLLWASGDRDGAAKCLERVVQVSANDVASRALLGEYYLGARDPVPAISPLEQALGLERADTPVRRNLTEMLFTAYIEAGGGEEQKGRHEEAVSKYYDKAILLVPENPNGYARKAGACAQVGQFAEAAAALRKLGALQPANPTVYLSLGDVLYQGGSKDEARVEWQRALALTADANPALRDALLQRLNGPITEDTFR